MNNGFNGADIIMTYNGEVIGEMKTFKVEHEREIKDGESISIFNREFNITLSNVKVDVDYIGKLLSTQQAYKLVGTSIHYPRGNKLPKRKRIRNKWLKKYSKDFTLDNCYFN